MSIASQSFKPINLDHLSDDPKDLDELSHVFSLYASYAHAKATAMRYRVGAKPDIQAALAFEKNAEHTYKLMPKWAKW